MNNEQLKELVNRNTRPDRYNEGDRVIFRAPEAHENNNSFHAYKHHVGRTGVVTSAGLNNGNGTARVRWDDQDMDSDAVRTHWIELYYG